eukprot:SAG22_NODE_50_length_24611_cov_74.139687_9_plen_667_part_00
MADTALQQEVERLRAQAASDTATIVKLRAALAPEPASAVAPPAGGKLPEGFAEQVAAAMPTEFGQFEAVVFAEPGEPTGDIAMVYGGKEQLRAAASAGPALARIHSSCFTGEVVGSHRCDCGEQLTRSMQTVAKEGAGVVLYLQQEGRGIGLINKLKAYNKQDGGLDTIDANLALGLPADGRDYSHAAAMLSALGVSSVRLITNNPDKVEKLQQQGIAVVDRVPIVPTKITGPNFQYLRTKADRMGHVLGSRFQCQSPGAGGGADATLQADLPWEAGAAGAAAADAGRYVLPTDRPAVLFENKPPFPVVDVNDLWLGVCGFERSEVVGKTMRIIQGPLTERGEVGRLLDTIFLASLPEGGSAIEDMKNEQWSPPSASLWTKAQESEEGGARQPVAATLINYTKTREPMRNEIEVTPVGGADDGEAKPHLLAVSTFTHLSSPSHTMPTTDDAAADSAASASAMETALAHFKTGGMVLVADDLDRENEGDLIVAAEFITAEQVAFMVRWCTGIVCVAMDGELCDKLRLPLMVEQNEEYMGTKFCVTVDKKVGTTTGVSAYDRALTINALADPNTTPGDLVRPGHIFPLRYTPGGVLARGGHTEASVDLCKLTGLAPAGCICELVKHSEDNVSGEMAQRDDMTEFARLHNLPTITIAQMQAYVREHGGI